MRAEPVLPSHQTLVCVCRLPVDIICLQETKLRRPELTRDVAVADGWCECAPVLSCIHSSSTTCGKLYEWSDLQGIFLVLLSAGHWSQNRLFWGGNVLQSRHSAAQLRSWPHWFGADRPIR